MTRETSAKVVGLCHGHHGVYEMASVLGLDHDHVSWQAVGFNHVIYLTHFFYKGEDGYAILDKWIETKAEDYWRTHVPEFWDNQMSRAAITQYKMVGLMPIGDTVRDGGWWYHLDDETKRYWYGPLGGFDSKEGWAIYIAELESRREQMFQLAADPSAKVSEVFPATKSTEQIVPIMLALARDVSGYFQVNIPNQGLIAGLPDDIVVEVPAFVSKRGIQGIKVGRLPDSLMAQVIYPRLAEAESTLAFAKSPSRGLMLHRLLTGRRRRVASYAEAEQEVDRILDSDPELAQLVGT
jgi:alpha-galactosidase